MTKQNAESVWVMLCLSPSRFWLGAWIKGEETVRQSPCFRGPLYQVERVRTSETNLCCMLCEEILCRDFIDSCVSDIMSRLYKIENKIQETVVLVNAILITSVSGKSLT